MLLLSGFRGGVVGLKADLQTAHHSPIKQTFKCRQASA